MARKKKSRRDARGYQQTSAPSAAAPASKKAPSDSEKLLMSSNSNTPCRFNPARPFVMTTAIQNQLEELLLLCNNSPLSSMDSMTKAGEELSTQSGGGGVRSDRFAKRIGNIYDDLVRFGFNFADICAACVAHQSYDMSLDSALDWLCFHLRTTELPPLFTEGKIRDDDEQVADTGTLDVIIPETPKEQASPERVVVESFAPVRHEPKKEVEDISQSEQKQWILGQYQYVDDSATGEDGDKAADIESPRQQSRALTPDEEELEKLRDELETLRSDLADEAGNYMRSKYEIKDMQKRSNQLTKRVKGLERKVQRANFANQAKHEESNAVIEENVGASLFGGGDDDESEYAGATLFGGKNEECENAMDITTKDSAESNVESNSVRIPEDSIPASWTGKTPKLVLEEMCRKQKARPKFQKSKLNGCTLSLSLPKRQPVSTECPGPVPSYLDAQNFAAAVALYEISPDLPLYRLFPPFYRDLWKGWSEQDHQVTSADAEEKERQRVANIEELIAAIENSVLSSCAGQLAKTGVGGDEVDQQNETKSLGSWDDIESEEDDEVPLTKELTAAGLSLKQFYVKLQQSPQYGRMSELRAALPIFQFRDQITSTIQKNPVTIICAETGAGKTTQCPQYLLEDALTLGIGDKTSIICTQPRRVAATSVAERVSEEFCEERIGGLVGYQIRLESRKSSRTRLTFCTTGVLLRRLVEDPALSGVTHVVVDEVHERQWQIDVLLVMLRSLLRGQRPDLKVILMSATLNAELFRSFYGGAPVLNIPGRTFPVLSYYLEDAFEATNHVIEENSRYSLRNYNDRETASLWVTAKGGEKKRQTVALESETENLVSDDFPGYSMTTRRSMDRVDESQINYDLIEDVLDFVLCRSRDDENQLAPPDGVDMSTGSVLVFLPGAGEIRTLLERLQGSRTFGKRDKFSIVQLHSLLSSKEQRLVFEKTRPGCRKIVLATNILETSVTIADAVCVLDCGRVREIRYDKRTSTRRLISTWCSRASAKQRAGRAGRVQPGLCIKLYSSKTEAKVMRATTEPEIKRMPLEEVCLNVLASGYTNDCRAFLAQTPEAPYAENILTAIRVLAEIGAIETNDTSGKSSLTPLGLHLSRLPVDVRLGKMMVFGALFSCVEVVVTIVAGLSATRSPFLHPSQASQQAKACHAKFRHELSDFLTFYKVWEAFSIHNHQDQARKFCNQNYLSLTVLKEMSEARAQFLDNLAAAGFLDRSKLGYDNSKRAFDNHALKSSHYNKHGRHEAVVHAIVCAGVYPNVAHLNATTTGESQIWHRQERLYIHQDSVNSNNKLHRLMPSQWLAFHEKFGSGEKRVSISTSCFVHPFSILLFGGSIQVEHAKRQVIVDDWIQVPLAAKTAVMLVHVKKQLDRVLDAVVKKRGSSATISSGESPPDATGVAEQMLDGIAELMK